MSLVPSVAASGHVRQGSEEVESRDTLSAVKDETTEKVDQFRPQPLEEVQGIMTAKVVAVREDNLNEIPKALLDLITTISILIAMAAALYFSHGKKD